jgi:hypothetical protein
MTNSVISTLDDTLAHAAESVRDASAALDEAILHDPELSHKTRLVLIHLQTAARRHQLLLEQMAICIDHVDTRIDILKNHVLKS